MRTKLISLVALSTLAFAGTPFSVANAAPSTTQLLMPNDFRGVGKSQQVAWNTTTAEWLVNGLGMLQFGMKGDIPTPINYGDGVSVVGVFRPSNGTWYLGTRGRQPEQHGQVRYGW